MKQAVPVTDRLNSAWMGQAKRNSVLRPRCSVNGNAGLESACDFASVAEIGPQLPVPQTFLHLGLTLTLILTATGSDRLNSAWPGQPRRNSVLRPRCHSFACLSACDRGQNRVRRVAIESILLGQARPGGTPSPHPLFCERERGTRFCLRFR